MSLPLAAPEDLAADRPEAGLVAVLAAIEQGTLRMPGEVASRLAVLLSHPSPAVRRRASGALGRCVAAGDVEPVLVEALLEVDDAPTRWGAAFALHLAGRPTARVIDLALETFGQDNGDLRWAASSVLVAASATAADLVPRLRALAGRSGSATTRKMALLCLSDIGERDGAFASQALADEDTYVRLAAVTVLGRLGDAGAPVREALRVVADSDAEATVRRAAAAVLQRLGRGRSKDNP